VVQPGDSERPAPDLEAYPPARLTGEAARADETARTPETSAPAAPPVTKGDGGMWIVLAAVGFLIGEIVGVILTVVVADILGKGAQLSAFAKMAAPPEWYIGAGLVGLWVGFAGGALMASRFRGTGNPVADFGIRFRPVDALGVVVGIGGQFLVVAMYAPFQKHIKDFNGPVTKLTGASHGGGFVVIAILTVLGAPFFEELFFRGLLLRGLLRVCAPARGAPGSLRTLGVAAAVVADGLLFALAHGELVQLAGLAVFGAILALLAYRTKRLGMSMVAHASFNLVAVLVLVWDRGGVIH